MHTTTLLFGNGLGRALDDEYFNLTNGIYSVWNNYDLTERNIVSLGRTEPPISEQELEDHHSIVSATKILQKLKNENITWLQPSGERFEEIYGKFIFDVSSHFYDYEGHLPNDFISSLSNYIKNKILSLILQH